MTEKHEYVNIDVVASISVDARSGRTVIRTKDGREIRCRKWRTVEIGGRAFVLAEGAEPQGVSPGVKSLLFYGAQLALAALFARRIRLPPVRA